jgi:hypothetical protein
MATLSEPGQQFSSTQNEPPSPEKQSERKPHLHPHPHLHPTTISMHHRRTSSNAVPQSNHALPNANPASQNLKKEILALTCRCSFEQSHQPQNPRPTSRKTITLLKILQEEGKTEKQGDKGTLIDDMSSILFDTKADIRSAEGYHPHRNQLECAQRE